jgi:tRNA A22 N-methylase
MCKRRYRTITSARSQGKQAQFAIKQERVVPERSYEVIGKVFEIIKVEHVMKVDDN